MDAIRPLLTGNARYLGFGDPNFYNNLAKFLLANPYGAKLRSLDRDMTKQQDLYAKAIRDYGSANIPGHQVARPGHSMHEKGAAGDIAYANPQAKQWAHEHAAEAGFHFPVPGEDWHIEAIGSRKTLPSDAANAGRPAPQQGNVDPYGFSTLNVSGEGVGATAPNPQGMAIPQPQGVNYMEGLAKGLDGLTSALARSPQQAQPMTTQRGGVAGPGGPQYAPLAPQFQTDYTPPGRSKRLSDMLAGLAGGGLG